MAESNCSLGFEVFDLLCNLVKTSCGCPAQISSCGYPTLGSYFTGKSEKGCKPAIQRNSHPPTREDRRVPFGASYTLAASSIEKGSHRKKHKIKIERETVKPK